MNSKWYMKYSFRLFWKKASVIPVLIAAISFFELTGGAAACLQWACEMIQPKYIRCAQNYSASGNAVLPDSGMAENMNLPDGSAAGDMDVADSITSVYEYKYCTGTVFYNEFYADAVFIGIDQDSFDELMAHSVCVQPSGSMPYAVVEKNFTSHLKNEDGQTVAVKSEDDIIAKNIETGGEDGQAAGQARICGILNEKWAQTDLFGGDLNGVQEKEDAQPVKIFMTLVHYEMLMSGDARTGEKALNEKPESDIEENTVRQYFVHISRGLYLDRVIEYLQKNGMAVNTEDQLKFEELDEKRQNGIEKSLTGAGLLLCVIYVCRYRWKTWKIMHMDFIEYAGKPEMIKRLGRYFVIWHLLAGGCTGCILYGIM